MTSKLLICLLLVYSLALAELTSNVDGSFTIRQTAALPGTPDELYTAMTGDISPWWDHTFRDQPHALRIEPWVGGRFIEEFDDQGNGALHATVILADRPKLLRYEGPMGMTGRALDNVVTYEFSAQGDSTLVQVTVQLEGQIDAEWAGIVDNVWHHFLIEAFAPYVVSGKHK